MASNLDPNMKLKTEDMLHKFLKYWDGIKNMNRMLIIASIIDPRKKMILLNFFWRNCMGRTISKPKK